MNTTKQNFDLKTPKKAFSRIGLALIALLLVTIIVQIVLVAGIIVASHILGMFNPSLIITELSYSFAMLLSMGTQYLIGFPVFYLIIRGLKTDAPSKIPCKISTLVIAFIISVMLLYVGQNIGNFVYLAIYEWTGINLSADILAAMESITLIESFIYTVICAPIFEELMFRKLIIDRTRMYGEKLSLFFSALLFALFHMNIQQFFYAFFVGLLLGYLYLRRGNAVSCMLLHAAINFFGGIIPLILYRIVDIDAMTEIVLGDDIEAMIKLVEENLIGYTLVSAYGFALMGLSVAGFVLYIIKARRLTFKNTALKLPRDSEATVAFTNVGVVLLVLFSVVYPLVNAYLATKM